MLPLGVEERLHVHLLGNLVKSLIPRDFNAPLGARGIGRWRQGLGGEACRSLRGFCRDRLDLVGVTLVLARLSGRR